MAKSFHLFFIQMFPWRKGLLKEMLTCTPSKNDFVVFVQWLNNIKRREKILLSNGSWNVIISEIRYVRYKTKNYIFRGLLFMFFLFLFFSFNTAVIFIYNCYSNHLFIKFYLIFFSSHLCNISFDLMLMFLCLLELFSILTIDFYGF